VSLRAIRAFPALPSLAPRVPPPGDALRLPLLAVRLAMLPVRALVYLAYAPIKVAFLLLQLLALLLFAPFAHYILVQVREQGR